MLKTRFWLKWAVINASALFLGLLAGSRFGDVVGNIAFASIFDQSNHSRASFATASTAGTIAGVLVIALVCLAALLIAQRLIWDERDEPDLALWSIIGVGLLPVGIGVGALASELTRTFVVPRLTAEYLGFAVGGMVIGTVQWLVLRHRVSLVGSSMLTNAIALPLGLLALQNELESYPWILFAILGVLYFALVGLPLLWLSPKRA